MLHCLVLELCLRTEVATPTEQDNCAQLKRSTIIRLAKKTNEPADPDIQLAFRERERIISNLPKLRCRSELSPADAIRIRRSCGKYRLFLQSRRPQDGGPVGS